MFGKTFQYILYTTLFAITTISAQILDSALVVDFTKILSETDLKEGEKPSVRYENGVKIVGEKTFDIVVKRGSSIKQIIYTAVEELGNCAYVISENQIIRLNPNFAIDSVNTGTIVPIDGSKIFTHDEAIYVSSDGTLFLTTNTMILVVKSKTMIQAKYADSFEGIPPLVHPTIREGKWPDVAEVRDESIAGSKIQVSKDGTIEAKKDE